MLCGLTPCICCRFQSSLPRGERRCCNHAGLLIKYISILAPTRGATFTPSHACFQFPVFQSSLPRGERHCMLLLRWPTDYFNPRSHEGSDSICCCSQFALVISILAPTRGATEYAQYGCAQKIFQSSLPRGERRYTIFQIFQFTSYFNPRSHEGSDGPAN